MLSYKVTYAVQILDLLQRSNEGMSLMDIRNHFVFLPSTLVISDITKQLADGQLISLPTSRNNKYHIKLRLDDITLHTLSHVVDGKLVFGTPVGFNYWQMGYLSKCPLIGEIEQQLESHVSEVMKSMTVGELLFKKKQTKNKLRVESWGKGVNS